MEILKTNLKVVTGLHIGGGDDTMQIGGIDSSVVKRDVFVNPDGSICYSPEYDEKGNLKNGVKKITEPYIPGSSLKGKMRSLLEIAFGLIRKQVEIYKNDKNDQKKIGKPIDSHFYKKCEDPDLKKKAKLIIMLFGESAGNNSVVKPHITRTIFRDIYLTDNMRKLYIEEKIKLSEEKAENTINRVTVQANPRFMERVPAGVEFDFEVVIREFEEDNDWPLKETIELGMMLLQADALGGGGSRGNGKIAFEGYKDDDLGRAIAKKLEEINNKLKSIEE